MDGLEQIVFMGYDTTMEGDMCNYDGSYYPDPSYHPDPSYYPDPSAFGLQFGNTVDPLYDASTGATWQPMDNSVSSIDPSLLAMSDPSLDISSYAFTDKNVIFPSQAPDYFNPNTYAPFSPQIPAAAPAYPVSALAEEEYHLSREYQLPRKQAKAKGREPTKQVIIPQRPKKTYQPAINGAGCPCTLCTGPVPKYNAFDLALLDRPEHVRKAIRKQNQKRFKDAKKAEKATSTLPIRPLKRKARETTLELASTLDQLFDDDESSDEDVSEDGEYRPTTKSVKTAAAKRRRVTRREAKGKGMKMPKGLGIDMKGW
ncbi:MAG: hypothetical protein Q9221_008057 [Calogaya cf. arnoldii]